MTYWTKSFKLSDTNLFITTFWIVSFSPLFFIYFKQQYLVKLHQKLMLFVNQYIKIVETCEECTFRLWDFRIIPCFPYGALPPLDVTSLSSEAFPTKWMWMSVGSVRWKARQTSRKQCDWETRMKWQWAHPGASEDRGIYEYAGNIGRQETVQYERALEADQRTKAERPCSEHYWPDAVESVTRWRKQSKSRVQWSRECDACDEEQQQHMLRHRWCCAFGKSRCFSSAKLSQRSWKGLVVAPFISIAVAAAPRPLSPLPSPTASGAGVC